ncbi:hypothetical protein K443DRAFT_682563 [Laccaria amethystina LaAM-08-1]|uniref:Uncharacterized protein n=1 Tax=Laccaria amethystina LaAM-08-1 TaxID=1095629 RepID=A0A0C9X498_9AGAR|nr:hypothetical protein K443DRAFT_682563 [Laccaria amethystina LaAM-08-1]
MSVEVPKGQWHRQRRTRHGVVQGSHSSSHNNTTYTIMNQSHGFRKFKGGGQAEVKASTV